MVAAKCGAQSSQSIHTSTHIHKTQPATPPATPNTKRTWRTLGSIKRLPTSSTNTSSLARPFPASRDRIHCGSPKQPPPPPPPPLLLLLLLLLLLPPCAGWVGCGAREGDEAALLLVEGSAAGAAAPSEDGGGAAAAAAADDGGGGGGIVLCIFVGGRVCPSAYASKPSAARHSNVHGPYMYSHMMRSTDQIRSNRSTRPSIVRPSASNHQCPGSPFASDPLPVRSP